MDGANRAHLQELARSTGRDFTAVMNDELRFAQALGLRPELEARLAAHLNDVGATVREWGMMEMWARALPLRKASAHAELTPLQRRRSRRTGSRERHPPA